MQWLTPDDIYGREVYEEKRPDLRRRLLVEKARRRVAVGSHCMVHFENRDTMHYQVQEMLRAENSWNLEGAVEAELEAYNPIIPQHGELSATLMLEYEDVQERAESLHKLVGLDQHLWLHIGDTPALRAEFDTRQNEADKIASVQYIKWHLNDMQRQLLQQPGTVVRLRIDHPHYTAQAVFSEETRLAIMHDPD